MALSDPIADMLTRIRNAGQARFSSVDIPASKLKVELARILKEEGYIRNYKVSRDNKQGVLRVFIKYGPDQRHAIFGIKRMSKPSRRIYLKVTEIKPVLNGLGVAVISTSKGVMTDRQARHMRVGGELMATIW